MAVQLLKRPLKRLADKDAPDIVVAILQKDADRKQFVRFSLSTRDNKTVEFHSHVSTTGRYAVPSGMCPDPRFSSNRVPLFIGANEECARS